MTYSSVEGIRLHAQPSRRQLLAAACSGLAVLAGCSSDQNSGSDGTESGGGAEPTPEPTATDKPTVSGNNDGSTQFGQVARFPESYAMTATIQSEGRTMEMTGRFYQGDMYWSFDQQGQKMDALG
ncbi:hypothetical protein [Haloarcula sp. CBA1129]|uniref:hypothetical protein n=1 Tax=Haloarcula sp. CBA1129 TaxID=1853684 RepID=UPI0012473A8E|nr:hypothetical protein [Haloarcula sp. CBA1129]